MIGYKEQFNTSFYTAIVTILVAIVIIAMVLTPMITATTQKSTQTSIDNDGSGWLKLGYAEGTDFDFTITDDGSNVTVGEQTGSLGDMIYYADENRVIFSDSDGTYLFTNGDAPTVYRFNGNTSVTNSNGTMTIYDGSAVIATVSSPAWAYYPDSQGVYGFFTNGNLNLLDGEPQVAVGAFAQIFAYNDGFVTPEGAGNLDVVMDGNYADEDVVWVVTLEETDENEEVIP